MSAFEFGTTPELPREVTVWFHCAGRLGSKSSVFNRVQARAAASWRERGFHATRLWCS